MKGGEKFKLEFNKIARRYLHSIFRRQNSYSTLKENYKLLPDKKISLWSPWSWQGRNNCPLPLILYIVISHRMSFLFYTQWFFCSLLIISTRGILRRTNSPRFLETLVVGSFRRNHFNHKKGATWKINSLFKIRNFRRRK